MQNDLDKLEEYILSLFTLPSTSLHGQTHWKKVEEFGLTMAKKNGADEEVIRLFALFHDACRENDDHDFYHGARGAELAIELKGVLFDLSDTQFALLSHACIFHTHGTISDDVTIGTCWDADRLDLVRVGVVPHKRYLSTQAGQNLLEESLTQNTSSNYVDSRVNVNY